MYITDNTPMDASVTQLASQQTYSSSDFNPPLPFNLSCGSTPTNA